LIHLFGWKIHGNVPGIASGRIDCSSTSYLHFDDASFLVMTWTSIPSFWMWQAVKITGFLAAATVRRITSLVSGSASASHSREVLSLLSISYQLAKD